MVCAMLSMLLSLLTACSDKTTATPDTADAEQPCTGAPADCVDAARYAADLEAFAVLRPPGSAGWQEVQDACADELTRLGFDVQRQDYGTGVNVIGRQAGTAESPRTVVLSAHYDHLDDCVGADDNATGVAGVLEVARVLAGRAHANDLVVACWDEEESGLIGSRAYADDAAQRGEDIAVAYSLEMIGYADDTPGSQTLPAGFDVLFADAAAEVAASDSRGDFIALIADERAAQATAAFAGSAPTDLPVILVELTVEMTTAAALSDLQRSDHASFWDAGYPAIMVTDTANFRYAGYHCRDGEDTVDRLDLDFAVGVVQAAAGSVLDVLQ